MAQAQRQRLEQLSTAALLVDAARRYRHYQDLVCRRVPARYYLAAQRDWVDCLMVAEARGLPEFEAQALALARSGTALPAAEPLASGD